MEKVLQERFWAHFFGHPYHSSGTKIHLDASLQVATRSTSQDMTTVFHVYMAVR